MELLLKLLTVYVPCEAFAAGEAGNPLRSTWAVVVQYRRREGEHLVAPLQLVGTHTASAGPSAAEPAAAAAVAGVVAAAVGVAAELAEAGVAVPAGAADGVAGVQRLQGGPSSLAHS